MSEKTTRWRKSQQGDEDYVEDSHPGCCEMRTDSGRCHNPGSFSHGGPGAKYFCKDHYFRNTKRGVRFDGDAITLKSHYEIPNPDYSLKAREKLSYNIFMRGLGQAIQHGYKAPKTSEVIGKLVD